MKREYRVSNIKCEGCATSVKSALKEEFGEVKVNLEEMPRIISVDIKDDEQDKELREKLRKLGYPFADEDLGTLEDVGLKAKSFVSCAIGKIDNFTAK